MDNEQNGFSPEDMENQMFPTNDGSAVCKPKKPSSGKHIIVAKKIGNFSVNQVRDAAVAASMILKLVALGGPITACLPAMVGVGIATFFASKGITTALKKHVIKKKEKKGKNTDAHLTGALVAASIIIWNLGLTAVPTIGIYAGIGATALIAKLSALAIKDRKEKKAAAACQPGTEEHTRSR